MMQNHSLGPGWKMSLYLTPPLSFTYLSCKQSGWGPIVESLIPWAFWVLFFLLFFFSFLLFKGHDQIGTSLVLQTVKNLPANAGNMGSIPGSGRSPGEGNGNPL